MRSVRRSFLEGMFRETVRRRGGGGVGTDYCCNFLFL